MDPNMDDPNRLSEQDLVKLGAQQAALIQMQQQTSEQQRMMEEQQKQQMQLQLLQAQALAEKQKEEELKRIQEIALMEKQKEEQIKQQMLIQQPPQANIGAPPIHMGPPQGQIPPMGGSPQFMARPDAPTSVPPFPGGPPSSAPAPVPQMAGGGPPAMSQARPMQPPQVGSGPPKSQPPPLMGLQQGPPRMATPGEGKPTPLMSIDTRQVAELKGDRDENKSDDDKKDEFKLPQALEKVLAYKGVRAQQVGVKPEEIEKVEKGELIQSEEESSATETRAYPEDVMLGDAEEEYDEEEEVPKEKNKKETKNKKRKKKKKRSRVHKSMQPNPAPAPATEVKEEDVEIEYVAEDLEFDFNNPAYREFAKIFDTFKISEPEAEKPPEEEKVEEKKEERKEEKMRGIFDEDSSDEDDSPKVEDDDKPKLSKKKMKKLNRLSVAELKQLVSRPDVVEMHDVTARDPKLLVSIKATRNSVPVPRHWCFKRKFLQGKRGIEKPPFELPDFIKNTGIMEMRQALQEKEAEKTLKSKMREKVRPKMGKIDIDYQKLHDAFFKYQVKPKMTIHGDLYYEGKEFETRLKEKKPGNLTDELRTALGMPLGANTDKYPPPWLIAMQRYGPPPSYPNLKVPGLNAPIPEGCQFGYHAGGWGKPPVDENGKPLYGDVFGTQQQEAAAIVEEEETDKTRWGELESESEEEEMSSEEEEEGEEIDGSGLVTPGDTGLITPSGVTSVPMGVETPDMIELRKRRIEDAMDQGGDTPALYTILPEKKTEVGKAMMGSAHVYDITAAVAGAGSKPTGAPTEGIEVALNPDELEMDTAAIQAKYDQTMKEQHSHLEKEDLSDMVAEHAARQKKRKKAQQDSGKSNKKYKEFKF